MGRVGFQEFWITGARLYFTRNSDANAALLDLGVIQSCTPTIESTKLELKDGDGGIRRTVDEVVTDINESYEIVCSNFNMENLALAFMSNAPEELAQTTDKLTAVVHKAVVGPGKYVKLKDANGVYLYNITAAVVKDSDGTTTYVEDTDWKWLSKARGIIQILSTGSIKDGDSITIDITPAAISGKRLLKPQTSSGAIKGKALIVFGRENNTAQTMREAEVSLTPSATSLSSEDYSSFTLTAKVLSDITSVNEPAGRMLQPIGTLPE